MSRTIRLQARAQTLLDNTDSDVVDRYKEYLLDDPDRHLWLSKTVLVDVDEIIRRRFACNTHLCLKHSRGKDGQPKVRTRYSCCWDLEVQLLPTEIEAIEKNLDRVFKRHPRLERHVEKRGFWKYDDEWWKILRKKKDGSCIFLDHSEELGMSVCALHSTALSEKIPLPKIKPLICRMFPIFLLESDDVHVVTCYGERTHRILFDDDYETMNCLHPNEYATDHVYRFMRSTLEALVGKDGYTKIEREADQILAADESRDGNGRVGSRRPIGRRRVSPRA
jgi:Fe-S-cluster containining protein